MTHLARWSRPALASIALLVMGSALPRTISAQTGPPRLAGTWTLDQGKSESARKKVETTRGRGTWGHERTGQSTAMHAAPVDVVPPRGALYGARHDSLAGDPRSPEMRLMMQPPERLVIEQTDSTVIMVEGGAVLEVLVIGLPQDKAGAVAPAAVHVPASWSDGRLLALRQDERRARAAQKLELSADGRTLTLTVSREPYEDHIPPLELQRVYVRGE